MLSAHSMFSLHNNIKVFVYFLQIWRYSFFFQICVYVLWLLLSPPTSCWLQLLSWTVTVRWVWSIMRINHGALLPDKRCSLLSVWWMKLSWLRVFNCGAPVFAHSVNLSFMKALGVSRLSLRRNTEGHSSFTASFIFTEIVNETFLCCCKSRAAFWSFLLLSVCTDTQLRFQTYQHQINIITHTTCKDPTHI